VVIETERLLLRPLAAADLDELVELHADPEVTWFLRPLDRAAAVERLRDAAREWDERGYGMFAVLDRAADRFLGRVGLKHWPQFEETELGWVLRRDAWGRGYATEAARACLDWGFRTAAFPYLTAMIAPGNARSIELARRLSMAPARRDVLLGIEVVVYAISREHWSARLTAP
jgi:RimJ/RimL family protein N-acetyltransferase